MATLVTDVVEHPKYIDRATFEACAGTISVPVVEMVGTISVPVVEMVGTISVPVVEWLVQSACR